MALFSASWTLILTIIVSATDLEGNRETAECTTIVKPRVLSNTVVEVPSNLQEGSQGDIDMVEVTVCSAWIVKVKWTVTIMSPVGR
jgi:hypothetical protein